MKILYTNFQSKDGGGHVTYIMSLLKNLSPNHSLSVATPNTSRLFKYASNIKGVNVYDQWYSSRFYKMLPQVLQLRRLIKLNKYDIIHISGSADHRHLMFACMGMRKRPKLVFTKHNDHKLNSFGNQLRAKYGTDHTIAVSSYIYQLLENSPYKNRAITTIRHGIDTEYFAPVSTTEKNDIRNKLFGENHSDYIVFGSSGGTDYDKGWLDLLSGLAKLSKDKRDKFRVIVAGSLPNDEKTQKVADLGLTDVVVFPGLLDDVRPILSACDIGFVLSYREALSYACREVMALGLPALVSDAGGLPENVENNVDGWVVPTKSSLAIATVLEQILDSPDLIKNMGRNAREKANNDFSMQPFVDKTLAVYNTVLNN